MERKSRPSPLSFSSRDASVSSLGSSTTSGDNGRPQPPAHRSPSPRGQQQQQQRSPTSLSRMSSSSCSRGTSPCPSPTHHHHHHGYQQQPSESSRTTGLAYLASRRSSVSSSTNTTCPSSPGGQQYGVGGSRTSSRRQSNFLELPDLSVGGGRGGGGRRSGGCRVNSLPVVGMQTAELYRLRSFHITGNNRVVNCGDSFIPLVSSDHHHQHQGGGTSPGGGGGQFSSSSRSLSRTSPSPAGVTPKQQLSPSPRSSRGRSPLGSSCCGSDVSSCGGSSDEEDEDNMINDEDESDRRNLDAADESLKGYYRVVLLGASKVGKSALVEQFMTSEYINTYDASLDEDFGERRVSVLLDELESELIFIDHPSSEMSAENSLSTYGPAGVIVVYSVTDLESYRVAGDILRYLWQEGLTHDKAVILVGNKCDLERARVVSSQEGKSLASSYESKFIETSSGIQHNVDELLVGTLKQCRLRDPSSCDLHDGPFTRKNKKNKKKRRSRRGRSRTGGGGGLFSLHDLARELLGKLVFYSSVANHRDHHPGGGIGQSSMTTTTSRRSRSCENLYVL